MSRDLLGPQRARSLRLVYPGGEIGYTAPHRQEFVILVVGFAPEGEQVSVDWWRENLGALGLHGDADCERQPAQPPGRAGEGR